MQKADGSFGESLHSYEVVSSKGQGNSTPSQTAWGLIGLLAGADPERSGDCAGGGLPGRSSRHANGSWSEEDFTGTGFPGVFYLKYHLYKNSFPVYALARYRNQAQRAAEYCAVKFKPGEFPAAQRPVYRARTARFLSKPMRYPLRPGFRFRKTPVAGRNCAASGSFAVMLSLDPLGGCTVRVRRTRQWQRRRHRAPSTPISDGRTMPGGAGRVPTRRSCPFAAANRWNIRKLRR